MIPSDDPRPPPGRMRPGLRIALATIVAFGLGHALGRHRRSSVELPPAPAAPVPSEGVVPSVLSATPGTSAPRPPAARAIGGAEAAEAATARPPAPPEPAPEPPSARTLVVAGGPLPMSNEISLEEDARLAAEALGPQVVLLYGSGDAAPTVRVEPSAPEPGGDPLRRGLAALFDPRPARWSALQAPALRAHGAARAGRVLERLGLLSGGAPLQLVLIGHGEPGDPPAEGWFALWEDGALTVRGLAEALRGRPPHRVIVAACHAGAFAELAFEGADPTAGAASTVHCGLFATLADRQSSGCDPDPDRRRHEGYALFTLRALQGRDAAGVPLPRDAADPDRDGRISWLEAHARARVDSPAIDVPTSTSERWLRASAGEEPPEGARPVPAAAWPEEAAVVEGLAARLGLAPEPGPVLARLARVQAELGAAEARRARAASVEEQAWRVRTGALRARWPRVDDPWHPGFEALLRDARAELIVALREGPGAAEHRAAQEALEQADEALEVLARAEAPLERLARALENLRLAAVLQARDPAAHRHFQALLACERAP